MWSLAPPSSCSGIRSWSSRTFRPPTSNSPAVEPSGAVNSFNLGGRLVAPPFHLGGRLVASPFNLGGRLVAVAFEQLLT